VPEDSEIAFEIQEWYLRHDGEPWGPVDLDALRLIVGHGEASGSTLVRRDGHADWVRLDVVLPDWERLVPDTLAEPAVFEPALRVFKPHPLAQALQFTAMVAAPVAVAALLLGHMDLEFLAIYFSVGFVVEFAWALRERVEITENSVRVTSRGRHTVSIPREEIDLSRSGASRGIGRLTGDWRIRSRDKASAVINRRAYGREAIHALENMLGIDQAPATALGG
jgi:hypothetical protein